MKVYIYSKEYAYNRGVEVSPFEIENPPEPFWLFAIVELNTEASCKAFCDAFRISTSLEELNTPIRLEETSAGGYFVSLLSRLCDYRDVDAHVVRFSDPFTKDGNLSVDIKIREITDGTRS